MIEGQLELFPTKDDVNNLLEKYVDYSDLGKTQAMERDLDVLTGFINHYSETMIPLLESYLRKKINEQNDS
tara:strand:+ start:5007 stop:5219 length:213 start_codon:yes stop_codon:yes gene_type:complete